MSDVVLSAQGVRGALRRLRDPLLLGAAPIVFAILVVLFQYRSSWPIGFDFRGTLWEPARAVLDGTDVYPEPTRETILLGNPAVYPPLFVLLSLPLALLPVGVASWLWFALLGASVYAALRILGIRDWRCLVLAVTSPVVVHGLSFGNLTVLLLLPLALAWRWRDRARLAGLAVGVAIAAKLFVWPLLVWLLLTRRFAAAAWALGSAVVLVLAPWALIGFDGLTDYPALLREAQDVYAVRSFSLATVFGALGASVPVAVAGAGVVGAGVLGLAAWGARGDGGDRHVFVLAVAACVVLSPIVWPSYLALLLVPIAISWPRLAPAWFFGYVAWLVLALSPNPAVADVCCRPEDVSAQAWLGSHAEPLIWEPLGLALITFGVALSAIGRGEPRSAVGLFGRRGGAK